MPKVKYDGPLERPFKLRIEVTGESCMVHPGKAFTLTEESCEALEAQHPKLFEIVSGRKKAEPVPEPEPVEEKEADGKSESHDAT